MESNQTNRLAASPNPQFDLHVSVDLPALSEHLKFSGILP